MEKDHLNDKVLDKEKALSAIKTSYLNSYKVIVAGARDFADYAYMKKKQKTSVNNLYFPEKGCHLGTNRSDNET